MNVYREIISRFPRGGLSYIFAYGSGVKQQIGYDAVERQKNNIIDLMFCVKDALGWHAENINRHPDHYSALRLLGPQCVMKYQEQLGAGVYCNTLIPLDDIGVTVKYGVVSREHLIEDLLHWKHLYLAGRLHKPVCDIVPPTEDEQLVNAINKNLLSAFHVALLILPKRFNEFDLFHTISNLSYNGDFRMIFGENKHKVRNIVEAQRKDFFKLYEPVMRELEKYIAVDFSTKEIGNKNKNYLQFEQEKTHSSKEYHLRNVPTELRKSLVRNSAYSGSYPDIVEHLATTKNLSKIVQVSVNDIVWRSSITQSLKNIPTAGLIKSVVYSYRKAVKTFAK